MPCSPFADLEPLCGGTSSLLCKHEEVHRQRLVNSGHPHAHGPPGISEPSTRTRGEKDALQFLRGCGSQDPQLAQQQGEGFLSFSHDVFDPYPFVIISFIFLFVDFWLLWVFVVALSGLSLETRGATLRCGMRASHRSRFSCCRARAVGCKELVAAAPRAVVEAPGSIVVAHELSCSVAYTKNLP